jgi:hypothetical protein
LSRVASTNAIHLRLRCIFAAIVENARRHAVCVPPTKTQTFKVNL